MNNAKAIDNKPMSLIVISLNPVKIIIKNRWILTIKLINCSFQLLQSIIPKMSSIIPKINRNVALLKKIIEDKKGVI